MLTVYTNVKRSVDQSKRGLSDPPILYRTVDYTHRLKNTLSNN